MASPPLVVALSEGRTMFVEQLRQAVLGAPLSILSELARTLWGSLASGQISETEAEDISILIESRRCQSRTDRETVPTVPSQASGRPATPSPRAWTYFPPKRPQRSPDRARSLERRRTLASCGPLPPTLAAKFTTGELSVLWIVSEEVATKGMCALTLPELAARAGVGLTKARLALRIAQDLGLLAITERRVPYRPNLSNLIRVVSPAWKAWIARRKPKRPTQHPCPTPADHKPLVGPTGGGGFSFVKSTESNRFSR